VERNICFELAMIYRTDRISQGIEPKTFRLQGDFLLTELTGHY